ncbi:MAG TPA: GNAT family N-acetyltransferase [Pyrinomonadaceae bacterium]|jgi:GNAT superfamily N-acetyltransferase
MSVYRKINLTRTDEEIQNCYPVMAELRPHLASDEFLAQVKRQMNESNFKLVYLDDEGVKAVGGFRIAEWLAGGKYLEIEDLAVKSGMRSKGYGGALFDWIVEYANRENCEQIKLVSHVKRFAAHRFYLNKRMIIEAHYFSLSLK